MKKWRLILAFIVLVCFTAVSEVSAQCSICTKTAGQLGEKKARGLNSGIVYLMLTPFAAAGWVGYKWYKSEKANKSID